MSWVLEAAVEDDIDELMSWFSNAKSVDIWGGPKFRYPFDRSSFHEDCRWKEFSTHCLRTPDGKFAAFGQLGARYDRAHLARLITHPAMRGRGVGRRLIEGLIDEARHEQNFSKVALFVYRDNQPAYQCYLALGFEIQAYPENAPLADKCYYLARDIA
jgi:ribosomal protein S18 acetylase RimI-like enzyme